MSAVQWVRDWLNRPPTYVTWIFFLIPLMILLSWLSAFVP